MPTLAERRMRHLRTVGLPHVSDHLRSEGAWVAVAIDQKRLEKRPSKFVRYELACAVYG